MAADDTDARVARLEKKIALLEARLLSVESDFAARLRDVISVTRRRQDSRDAKMADLLKRIGQELTQLRRRLTRSRPATTASRLIH